MQRDCYSSFICFHTNEESRPDREGCRKDFENFLKCQRALLLKLKKSGFSNRNFGTKLLDMQTKEKAEVIAAVEHAPAA